jgi:parallel beta-helix repeat protein
MTPKNHLPPHPATLTIGAVILALAAVGAMLLGGGRASASHVGCGDTITADTRLDGDLVNCPNNGIVIGADGVTLNLNGHTIDGDGRPFAACPRRKFCDIGVVSVGHDGVTVVGGSMREFDVGAFVGNARRSRLLDISSSRNHSAGLGFFDVARSLVRHSSGSGSTSGGGVGMFLIRSNHNRILDNSFGRNGDLGIHVLESTANLIMGNLISRNKIGLFMEKANRNQVRRNRSVRDGVYGIYVAPGNQNVIARNQVFSTRDEEGIGIGISIDGGDHNVIARNSVRDTESDAISVGLIRVGFGPVVVGTLVRRNQIRGAGDDGVHVNRTTRHTLLKRNHAFGAKDDGLDANSSTTKLTLNEASRNGDLGIEAVRGVRDGGGNRASGNGDPRQCVNVTCH